MSIGEKLDAYTFIYIYNPRGRIFTIYIYIYIYIWLPCYDSVTDRLSNIPIPSPDTANLATFLFSCAKWELFRFIFRNEFCNCWFICVFYGHFLIPFIRLTI